MRKQIYGYTKPEAPAAGEYVRFVAAFKNDDGSVSIEVRNTAGITNEITVPKAEVSTLIAGLTEAFDP